MWCRGCRYNCLSGREQHQCKNGFYSFDFQLCENAMFHPTARIVHNFQEKVVSARRIWVLSTTYGNSAGSTTKIPNNANYSHGRLLVETATTSNQGRNATKRVQNTHNEINGTQLIY
ncbi:hypothetical protein V5799_012491 [Amblyomma americanum]|uniref:Uncharacterized protein n=1 Tax=Amblyomma americanum TaxID=6943 RepID=A0AAQ4EE17_AMBAM